MTEPLWAPWRMEFIQSIAEGGCFMCRAAAGGEAADGSLVIGRRGQAIAVLNRWPYSNGHVLVGPIAHKAELEQLDASELSDVFSLVRDMKVCLAEAVRPHGFNIGMNLGRVAGAGLPGHLHVHIVPRWEGDTNFMPVISDAKVIPEALSDSLAKLRAAWQALQRKEATR